MFSGGFKIPENVLKKQSTTLKNDKEDKPNTEEYTKKDQILKDLDIIAPNYPIKRSNLSENKKITNSKNDMADYLVTNIEKEIERLRKQSETLKMRREKEKIEEKNNEENIRKDSEIPEKRLVQGEITIEPNDPIKKLNFEGLQKVREEHKFKLQELEEVYNLEKQKAIKEGDELEKQSENLTYDELVNMRAFF